MGENTAIEWADHTFNPWIGCQKLTAACDNCYAEDLAERYGWVTWGPHGERKRTSETNWRLPLKWNRHAEASGTRDRVFCASLADVFDNKVPGEWRADLWQLIDDTPHLIWMLLTKRPENIRKQVPFHSWQRNVWLGTTAEDQPNFDRRWRALKHEDAVVRFISYEPALGPLDVLGGDRCPDFVICGGESGHNARPMHPAWARAVRDQCVTAGIPYHFKQWGEWAPYQAVGGTGWSTRQEFYRDGRPKGPWKGAIHDGGRSPDGYLFDGQAFRSRMLDDGQIVMRLGKKRAGRLLDGREWNEMPT